MESQCRRWLLNHASDMVNDHYSFKEHFLATAEAGWNISGVTGMVRALIEHGHVDVVARWVKRLSETIDNLREEP